MSKAPCKHPAPVPDACRWCAMAVHKDRRYLAAWWPDVDEGLFPVSPQAAKAKEVPCIHLGPATGEERECKTCAKGNAASKPRTAKVFACAVFETGCTIMKPVDGAACCRGCPENPEKRLAVNVP